MHEDKAEILNEHFATIGESCLPMSESIQSNILSRVTPTVMQIELSQDEVYEELLKTKPIKETGPVMVSPKLLKLADQTIVPSLTYIFQKSS